MVLHPAPPWSGYLEAATAGNISTATLPQCEAPSAAASILARSAAAAPALALSLALLLLLSPSLVLLLCSDLATLQSTESTFGSVDFQGVGGSPELRKNQSQREGGLAGGGRWQRWGNGVGIAREKARWGGC